MNTLENSTSHKPRARTMLIVKETKITPKLSMNMTFSPWKLPFETHSYQFLTKKNQRMGSGSLGAHQKKEMGV
jgi:hypothetical protein